MAGPFEAAGAVRDPSKYSALSMQGEQFTGLWTQAGPYRDAATAYLVRKFYQGNRIDRILDGVNREIFADLTDGRRPGVGIYNSNTFPGLLSHFSFKSINNSGTEIIRVLADGTDGNIYDATAGQKSTLLAKAAGAGPMRFQGVNTSLYMGDGKDLKKWIYPGGWVANTNVAPGTLINVGAEPGTVQMAVGGLTLNVVATSSSGTFITVYFNAEEIPNQFQNLDGVTVTFAGLTTATSLNGHSYTAQGVMSTAGFMLITQAQSAYAQTADTGTGTTGNGTTGGSAPSFSGTQFGVVADSGQQWKNYGTAIENWGLPTPLKAPVVSPVNSTSYWRPNVPFQVFQAILDANQNIEVAYNVNSSLTPPVSGRTYPLFGPGPTSVTVAGTATIDGQISWQNYGKVGKWIASTALGVIGVYVILDSNGNLQLANSNTGPTGGTQPAWATGIGVSTTDGGITWICLGPGTVLTTASVSYAFSTGAIDESVCTASATTTIQGPMLGESTALGQASLTVVGTFAPDTQLDSIWIWRTAQGGSTLVLEAQIGVDPWYLSGAFTYFEFGIPDTSTSGQGALNALIAAPVNEQNDPPPAGLTGMTWHLGRLWGFSGNLVYYSGGPDTLVGNGNTAWAPLNVVPYIGAVLKLRPITVQNGGILVYTTSGIWIILGTGTASNPFYTTIYCNQVNLGGYNVEDMNGTNICLMEANGKVSSLAVEYPFSPQSGYTEIGFPIGDQFLNTTTGGGGGAIYSPALAYLSWCVANSADSGMYVADGAVGWFRMSMVQAPESGIVWNPRATIGGGTSAVQSIEISPGVYRLLAGPPVGTPGPILMRDTTGTIFTDNGTAYPSWDAKGVILLCATGQETDIGWISTKSLAVGARPVISLLMGEIAATAQTPWNVLYASYNDPANLKPSLTAYCDRYNALQNGNAPKGDCVLIKFDYGSQAVGDKLLEFGIYGSTEEERRQ